MNPQETLSQLGTGISGALAYTGTNVDHIRFSPTSNTLYFRVNGRRGYNTQMTVKLDLGSDTYEVGLMSVPTNFSKQIESYIKSGKDTTDLKGQIVEDERTDVYCDELQSVFELMYDEHMKAHNGGMIPIGGK